MSRYALWIFISISVGLASCSYEHIELNKPNCNQPAQVTLSQNIQPLFDKNCNTSGCHDQQSHAGNIDLSPSNSYQELMRKGTGYIDTIKPEKSVLYLQMISLSRPMPPQGKLDDCSISLVLKWIQQGARK